ncbi:hypothetical protein D9757_012251 [Collybiopsis confluens]|uniref:Uncharacterized protein n=1 Tax=Collybiopsis confluens TaxID=2823264 RepID=A0A8H5LIG5_9AGAR|nr:hypothetical protein D9757_012251 [Collybiopsis confluens]
MVVTARVFLGHGIASVLLCGAEGENYCGTGLTSESPTFNFTVFAIPLPKTITAPPSTVTLYYTAISPQEASLLQNASDSLTQELTAIILGVSSGPDGGSETTYSFHDHFREDELFTITTTDSQGKVVTQTTSSLFADNLNFTLVESDGGYWETISPEIATLNSADGDSGHGFDLIEGEYLSCSFESGHQSAQCTGVALVPDGRETTITSGSHSTTGAEVHTSTESFEGSLVLLR